MFKILDKRNGEVTAEQQAVFNKISTNNADGYVDGFLNSLRIAKMSSNMISIDSGLLSIQGFRSVNDTLTTYTVSVTPSEPIPFQLVATYSHYISDENDTLEITTRPVQELRREPLFTGQNAVYEVELAEFNMTADGIADFTVTLEKIVYNEQDLTELLDKVTKAEQDSKTALDKVNALETQVIEKQGTAVYIGGEAQTRVDFDSDPQTQIAEAQSDINDIVSGAQTVGKATTAGSATNASRLGGADAASYAKLAQVVRTDAAQSLTTSEKQQAQKNIELQGSATLTTPAWYKIASVSIVYIAKIIRVKLTSSWDTDRPFSAEAIIAIAANSYSETTITTVGNFGHPTAGQSNIFSKIRLNGGNVEVYYNTSNSHTCKFEIENYDHNNANITIYDFETTSQSEVSGSCFVCDFVNGTNTSGGVYQNGASVFATDPSALTPSTANGWSQIGIKSDLPSEGTYYVYPSISGSVKLYGIATVVFDGTNNAFGATGGNFILNVAYVPAASTKWSFIFANGTELTPDYILYKRIN